MTVLSLVAICVLIVTGSGAYRINTMLTSALSKLIHPRLAKHISFVALVVSGVAICYPFLVPQALWIEILVWCIYLGLAAVGAWHIYDCLVRLGKSFPHIDS